jgi:hypothetical protein
MTYYETGGNLEYLTQLIGG